MKIVLKSRLREWTESPITELIRDLVTKERDAVYEERGALFIEGEAIKTQEIRSNLIGQEAVLQDIIDLINLEESALEKYFDLNGVQIENDEEIDRLGQEDEL